ncbi:MAG TPA: amidohydrolase family protein [Flavisolibacter sp.]|nr:amidohydrolase family protein [Flavisolibacter sp.]
MKSDKIFDGYQMLEGYVLIVSDDGTIQDLMPANLAPADVEVVEGILSPGLINCHCHLELSHMKGQIPEKTGLVDFVFKVVTERHASQHEIMQAIEMAEEEMISNGIVAVGDICNNTSTLSQKQKGRLQYYNFIEASGWLPESSTQRFETSKEIFYQFDNVAYMGKKPQASIVPHAPYSVSENLWQLIQPFFKQAVVSIHNQETKFEDDFFLEGTGDFERMYRLMKIDNAHHKPTKRSSLQTYFDKLAGASKSLLVHNTFTKQDDINYIIQAGKNWPGHEVYFCLCINANQYIEDALPPIELLRRNDCTVVLGTDSLASNRGLNILDEIRTIRLNFPYIPLEELLKWATSNGARALQLDDELGSFEKGKKPGLLLIDEETLQVQKIF